MVMHRKSGNNNYATTLWDRINPLPDYWFTQIPFVAEGYRAVENVQYWKDYKKNTGITPRYPARAYGTSGEKAINTVWRNVKRLYG